ncbi:hypothetical protein GHT06_011713 [Daphnia sinensis]|uniref:Torsin-1A-interacting protein 1/2 AAA+ activator domain-containing protein n=1 Tax=Daphnia sinensis TaxID=1820382 RepID=A0AAD5PUU1_9CRUS|nr:hypothetical protein GHT06_011713 [Daphnia sinensis]
MRKIQKKHQIVQENPLMEITNANAMDSNPITHDSSIPSSNEASFSHGKNTATLIKHIPQSESQECWLRVNCNNAFLYPAAIIILLLAICLGIKMADRFTFSNGYNNKISTPLNPSNHQVMELINEMKKTFSFQKDETWISFLAALGSVIEEKPSQPAVLLFIGRNTPAAIRTMQHVATTLAININELFHKTNSVNTNFQGVTVQVDEITDLMQQDDAIKQELDEQIRSILSKSFSVVIGPLQKIPPKAAMLLHGFCDNFMAPFKKSVIILTATFDYEIPRNSKAIERKLHGLWDPTLGVDKSASIVSRVANNVVFIEPETDSIASYDIGGA